MDQLERKYERILQTMDFLSNQNASMREELSHTNRQTYASKTSANSNPTVPVIQINSSDVTESPKPPRHQQPQMPARGRSNTNSSHAQKNPKSVPRPAFKPSGRLAPYDHLQSALSDMLSGSVTSLASDQMTDDNDDGFGLPEEQNRRLRRAQQQANKKQPPRKPRKIVTGKGAANFKTLQGAEANRQIYIYRVLMSTTEEDVREFLNDAGIEIRDINEVKDPKWSTKSFKVTIPASQLNTSLDLNWPQNVCVRQWIYIPQKTKPNQ